MEMAAVRRRAAVWLGAFILAVLLTAMLADRPWASYAALHHEWRVWAKPLTELAAPVEPLAAVGLLTYAATMGRRKERSRVWDIVLACSAAAVLALVAVVGLKYLVGRTWPETWVQNNPSWVRDHVFGFAPLHGGQGYASFPSGHTARVTAPFAVLWHAVPRFRALWVVPPLVVMAGLLGANFHFVSDCVAGIFVGVAAASAALLAIRMKNG